MKNLTQPDKNGSCATAHKDRGQSEDLSVGEVGGQSQDRAVCHCPDQYTRLGRETVA